MGSTDLPGGQRHSDLQALPALVRRVIAARTRDADIIDDLVQETLARVMTAQTRLDESALAPYAIVVARNLVSTQWQHDDRARRQAHRLLDPADPPRPEDHVLKQEERHAVRSALERLPQQERELLLAHEVHGAPISGMATQTGSTTGAMAARLHRTRAKLRVEYLLALGGSSLPTKRCRPILLALSAGDRRRQRELDAAGHLLECPSCSELSGPLLDRLQGGLEWEQALIPIHSDRDVVVARQRGRQIAKQIGFSSTDLTLIATAISEIARNVVQFADHGQVTIRVVEDTTRNGVLIIARDVGPGIPDVARALEDGYSAYGGMGLGLPGSRRLMDEFQIATELGKGTTVTMTKWRDA